MNQGMATENEIKKNKKDLRKNPAILTLFCHRINNITGTIKGPLYFVSMPKPVVTEANMSLPFSKKYIAKTVKKVIVDSWCDMELK